MTKYCDACHTANSDRAKYCRVCHGRFSGVRFGAHISASTFPDSLPAPGETSGSPKAPKRGSAAMRTTLFLVFLVLLLAPFSHWNAGPSPEPWPRIRNSVASAWQLTSASVAGIVKPLLSATSAIKPAARDEPARMLSRSGPPDAAPAPKGGVESALGLDRSEHAGDAPPASQTAPLAVIAAPADGAPDARNKECTAAQAALALCPKE